MTDLTSHQGAQSIDDNGSSANYMGLIFLFSLVVPILINVGPILLLPHRIVLLIFFFPAMGRLLSGRAGGIIPSDWMMFGSMIWAGMALSVNHGLGNVIEAVGIHMIEFFGAYLLARVSIRSSADFFRFVKCAFLISLFLLPFAAIESILKRNYLLEAIPNSIYIVNAPYRWGMRRAQTLFTHPIHFGLFAAIGIGFYWYWLQTFGKRLIAITIVILSTVFSLSSGALICVVCQLVFIAWESTLKNVKSRWRIFAGITAFLYVFLETFSNRGFFLLLITYASFNTGSAYNRILIWKYGMENVWANPFFGLGFRTWVRAHWMSDSADNFWLLIAMTYGIPSFLLFAGGVFYLFWKAAKTPLSDKADKICRAAFLTALGGLIIGGGTVHYWTAMMALFMFVAGSMSWVHTGGAVPDVDESDIPEEPTTTSLNDRYTRFPTVVPIVNRSPQKAADPSAYRRKPTLHERQKAMREARDSKKP